MAKLFFAIYPLAGFAYIIGYVPQIITLIRADAPPQSVSVASWLIWLKGNLITLGYIHFYLNDFMMLTTTGLCLFLSVSVLALTIYNKYYRFN